MTTQAFMTLLQPVTDLIRGKAIDDALADALNRRFPPGEETYDAIEQACHQGIADGWMCTRGAPGRRFGQVIEPVDETGGLSVDVVDLTDIVGPHHRHPAGEICMIMPITAGALFDGQGRGWCVNPPGSDHHPTVTQGEALVLYMLPQGKIEFTGR